MSKISELVNSIQGNFDAGGFDKFIHAVNFPKFKGFAANVKIEFRFPITVVVGPNGGGKSSILHAAWGMPAGYSLSRFWFSTPVDPISPDDNPRYWYTHYIGALKSKVQTRKRYGRKRVNYWEPTRPNKAEGMEAMPVKTAQNAPYMSATADRWTPVERTPHYFNAKAETSAFDRFFNSTSSSLEVRQDYFLRYSKKLKEVIDGELKAKKYYRIERVEKNFMLSSEQLSCVNRILQKKYKSARYISHKFYDNQSFSPSVIFETEARIYSECFAGSGELAVVNLVLSLEKLAQYDLLLLDEPETSLHPGAQERLVEHLLTVVHKKCLQVIISTHSPTFVELLPKNALVVLEDTPEGVVPRIDPTKSSAFRRLGHVEKEKLNVLTEDVLLKAIVDRAVERLERHLRDKIVVTAVDVGVSEMLSNQVRALIQTNAKVLMVLDGDQEPVQEIFVQDPEDFSPKQIRETVDQLKGLHISIVGSKLDLEGWMRWCKSHVILIEQVCAEQLLLELLDPNHPLLKKSSAKNSQFKDAVRSALKKKNNDATSEAQYHILKLKLGEISAGSEVDKKISALSQKLAEALHQFELH